MSGALREEMRKGWCPGALRPMMARDGLLVRLKITGGIVPAEMALAIADLAERHGNGLLDLSARANLQLRGVREEKLSALLVGLGSLELLDANPAAEAVRNVLASPLAGLGAYAPPRNGVGGSRKAPWKGQPPRPLRANARINPTDSDARRPAPSPAAVPLPRFAGKDIPDIRHLVASLERALVFDPALHALPAKFGFLVDDGGEPSLAGVAADIRFDWIAAEQAFAVGLGGTAPAALALGLVARDQLVARAIGLAHRLLARPGQSRRIGALVREIGRDATAAWFGAREAVSAPAPPNPQVVGSRTLNCVATLGLAAPFGRLDAAMLRTAADLAAEAGTGELRLTPWRTILVPQVKPEASDLAGLAAAGFIVDPADPRLRVAACAGQAGCERGTTDTHADATALADLAAALRGDDVALHVSGCAKGCARPARTSVTLVGHDGRYDLIRDGRACDEPTMTGLDLAAGGAELRGIGERASFPAQRGNGAMRSMVEVAAASMHPVKPRPESIDTEARQPLSPPAAVLLPRFTGEDAHGET